MKFLTRFLSLSCVGFLFLASCTQNPPAPPQQGVTPSVVSGYSQQDLLNSVFFSDSPFSGQWAQSIASGAPRTEVCKDVKAVRVDATNIWAQSQSSDIIAQDHCAGAFGTKLSVLYTQNSNPDPNNPFSHVQISALDLTQSALRPLTIVYRGENNPFAMGAFPPVNKVITASRNGDTIAFVVEKKEPSKNGIKIMRLQTAQGPNYAHVLDTWMVSIEDPQNLGQQITWWDSLESVLPGTPLEISPNPTGVTLTPDGNTLYFSVILRDGSNIFIAFYKHTLATKQTDHLFFFPYLLDLTPVRMFYSESKHELAWNTEKEMWSLDVQNSNLILNPVTAATIAAQTASANLTNNLSLVEFWESVASAQAGAPIPPFFMDTTGNHTDMLPSETLFSNHLNFMIGASGGQGLYTDQYIEVMDIGGSQPATPIYEIYRGPVSVGLVEVVN